MLSVAQQKEAAARKAVEDYLFAKDGIKVVGIGSGSTIVFAVNAIGEKHAKSPLEMVFIPTSFQAKQLITENGLTLGSLEQFPEIDVTFDGADEVDDDLNLIKGGGGCCTQEKIVAFSSKSLVIIADASKGGTHLLGERWHVPIAVIPMAYTMLLKKFEHVKASKLEKATLRMAKAKAGPLVTDNGNFIIDAGFGQIANPAALEAELLDLPGVVCTGLFVNMADVVIIGQADGSTDVRTRSN